MHSKKDTPPFLPLRPVNERSLLSSFPSDEPGEEVEPPSEIFSQNEQENDFLEDERESWDDEIEPLNAVEDDPESWEEEIDPFAFRRLPTIIEAAPIEEADIRHAFSQVDTHIIDNTPVPVPPTSRPRTSRRSVLRWQALPRRHKFFVVAGLLVVFLLMGDGALFLLNIVRPHAFPAFSNALTSPTLTVTPP